MHVTLTIVLFALLLSAVVFAVSQRRKLKRTEAAIDLADAEFRALVSDTKSQ